MSGSIDEQFILNAEALQKLYSWIDGIPFSRPKKNLARDFSDGVLCAELIAFFQPKMVDMHNYFHASSGMQKKINWNTLNRKVFCKMAIHLSENTMKHLIEAKPGAIEQVLWEIRRKVCNNNSEQQQTPPDGRIEHRNHPGNVPMNAVVTAASGSRHDQNEIMNSHSYHSSFDEQAYAEETPSTIILRASELPSANQNYKTCQVPAANAPASGSQFQENYQYSNLTQGYNPPAKFSASNMSPDATNNNLAAVPDQIIYRGHKMIPLTCLEEREREIKSLELVNKSLYTKINRVETLINVKDERIEDLTHQLHDICRAYELVNPHEPQFVGHQES